MYFGFRSTVAEFSKADPSTIVGRLHQAIAADGFSRHWTAQTMAWEEEVFILQKLAGELSQALAEAAGWTVLLEYEIARRGRRIDVVLLTSNAIVVLEFKVGMDRADTAARWQAYEYGLDLRDFHEKSNSRPIVPIVVPTEMQSGLPSVNFGLHDFTTSAVHEVIECPTQHLAATITAIHHGLSDSSLPPIDHEAWCSASYRPSLNIIEAAERVFAGHRVREISHATSTNLTATVDTVIRCVSAAQRHQHRVVCFVTGVPGAGKTLAGLSAVHDPVLREGDRPAAVFLSGNGPLVKVVRSALVRDLRRRTGLSEEGARQVSTFIQNVHSFLGHYGFKAKTEIPPEHVVIFDEAQRAWDGHQMAAKKRGSQSEAELLLEVMARCPDWSVIVALVGFGQEIHHGEAGLAEWGRAISRTSPTWNIVASPEVLDSALSTDDGSRLFAGEVPDHLICTRNPELHLTVNIRSDRARMVSEWVARVLDGNATAAGELFSSTAEFPVALTRDLDVAREWLRANSGGSGTPGSCGLLASSGALRLRPYGLEVSAGFRHGFPYEEWFLRTSDDVRSSSAL